MELDSVVPGSFQEAQERQAMSTSLSSSVVTANIDTESQGNSSTKEVLNVFRQESMEGTDLCKIQTQAKSRSEFFIRVRKLLPDTHLTHEEARRWPPGTIIST